MKRSRRGLIANASAAMTALHRRDDMPPWSRWMLWTALTALRFIDKHLDDHGDGPIAQPVGEIELIQREIDKAYVLLVVELIGSYGSYAVMPEENDGHKYPIALVYRVVGEYLSGWRADELNTKEYHDDYYEDESKWSAFHAQIARMIDVHTRELHVAPLTIVDDDDDDDDDIDDDEDDDDEVDDGPPKHRPDDN